MGHVNALLRVLGIGLLESVAARLPSTVAVVIQFTLIVAGSALPIIPLLNGTVALPDLMLYTVLAMALSVAGTVIRLRTIAARSSTSDFLMLHYAIMIGILSLVCGVWAVILLVMSGGPSGGWLVLAPMAGALLLANAWSLADGWFLRGGRHAAKVWQVVLPGYLRFVPLLLATVFGAIAVIGGHPRSSLTAIAIGLVVVQSLIDLSLAAAALKLRRRVASEVDDEPHGPRDDSQGSEEELQEDAAGGGLHGLP